MSCGLHHVGGVTLADNKDRFDMLVAERAKHRYMGLETEIIGPEEIAKIAPIANTNGIIGALYDPLDGHLDPSGTTHAYAKAARMGGATIETHTMVTATTQRADGTWDVVTDKGTIHTENVVGFGRAKLRRWQVFTRRCTLWNTNISSPTMCQKLSRATQNTLM